MSPHASVTQWLDRLRHGDRDVVPALLDRYFRQLVDFARGRLGRLPRSASDEEDVALSAFDSFCRRAEQGQFPDLADRHDLWGILVLITSRKVCDLVEYERRGRRDHRRREDAGSGGCADALPLDELLSREPDPALVAEMADCCRSLLARLGDEELRTIALRKLEGSSNEEIAALIGRSRATVERRLTLVRELWSAEQPM
jgi:DNA-directed RNA polymerase specialized sigma24 family protein